MKKILSIIFLILVIAGAIIGYLTYQSVYAGNVQTKGEKIYLQIPTGSTYADVKNELLSLNVLEDYSSFERVAKLKKYDVNIKAGRFLLQDGWNNNQLVNALRSGKQEAVKVTFNNARTKENLAGKIAPYLEFDSLAMLRQLNDTNFWKEKNIKPELVTSHFIPNTYQFFWNTTPKQFSERMIKEYNTFWNKERKDKAAAIKLSQAEVMTLASIVQSETAKKDEASKVAGVYLNRIRKGIPLQADPTLIFALGDFTIKRVLNKHKEIDSPYNTYMHRGLPPGPICVPEIYAIDGVLKNEKHDYIYFCAKEDFSGYHNFAKTYNEHIKNADKYQSALNKRKIYK